MIKKLLVLLVVLVFSSCATVLNKKTYNVRVNSYDANAQVLYKDSLYTLPAKLKVERSKEPLPLTLVTDSVTKSFQVKPSVNPQFLYLNLIGIYAAPILYGVDYTNPKRFYYGKAVTLSSTTTDTVLTTYLSKFYKSVFTDKYAYTKGDFNLMASIPYFNQFRFKPNGYDYKNQGGFFGIGLGAEYYYSNRKFINVTANILTDVVTPVPAPVDDDSEIQENFTSYNVSVTDNYQLGKFTLGYGINYAANQWHYTYYSYFGSLLDEDVKETNHNIGLIVNGYVKFYKYFFLGAVYRPSVYKFNAPKKWQYESTFSLDLVFKLPLVKHNK